MKYWYASKTLWLNIIVAALAIVQALEGQAWLPASDQIFIVAVLNALIRLLTNTAIAGTPAADDITKPPTTPKAGA